MTWLRFFFYSFVSLLILALVGAAIFLTRYILPRTPRGDFAIVTIGDVGVIAEIAKTEAEQSHGLSGRNALVGNTGMLFPFSHPGLYPFWMKDMKFPIDIFWIENGRVVDMIESARPFPAGTPDRFLPVYRPDAPARFVLETVAGFAARYGITIGTPATIKF